MYNYICEECQGRCDAGELVGGKCPECLEKERIRMVSQNRQVKIQTTSFEQMRLDLGDCAREQVVGDIWQK